MAALLLVLSLIVLNELHLPVRIDEMTPRLEIRLVAASPTTFLLRINAILCTGYDYLREL